VKGFYCEDACRDQDLFSFQTQDLNSNKYTCFSAHPHTWKVIEVVTAILLIAYYGLGILKRYYLLNEYSCFAGERLIGDRHIYSA